jgi:hypothetical protein
MSPTIGSTVSTIFRGARPQASLFVTIAAYWFMKATFFLLTDHVGLISPSGSPNRGVIVCGAIVVGLRVWVLFVVPAILVYQLGRRVSRR